MGKMAWSESPLICFLQKDTKIHSMRACHTLVVVNNLENLKKKRIDSQVQVIEHNEKKIRKAISVCIEKGIQNYIEKLINIIKHSKNNSSEDLIDFHMELKAISKHVILEENTYQHAFKRNDFFSIPQEIRDLLSREPHVNSFGIWEDATFKIFMDETLDADILKEKLKRKYQTFFEKHRLHIERKKFIMKCATQLKQGGELRKPSPSGENVECGTLGGFVKDTKSSESCSEAYALTCNHLYPSTNDPAYANIDGEEKEIGKCIFTTRENSCDFAVIEISKDFSDKCDLEFRRDDEKSCNAEVSEFFPIHVGIVHKNGSKTNWTRGRVVSRAFYDVVNKRESFVVKGLGCPFSTPGDSGSIVFARDNSVSQYAVDVLGMVYSNHPDIRDDTSQPENEKVDEASGHSEINLKSGTDQCYSTDGGKTKSDQIRAKIMKNPENYSFCFRMNNAFELLEKEKNLLVSFERVVNLDERDDD
ncbi:uncharacterized protein LOC134246972 [Saccostrea cucullata]|uniref:uncharacterized protein LOC134246972 n=1 Tax=Saccostrea cuccullata TaxID=36930 RepID=UPI002ED55304